MTTALLASAVGLVGGYFADFNARDDEVEIRPLASVRWDWWRLEDIVYHGKKPTVIFDRTGRKSGKGRGLSVCDENGEPVRWRGSREQSL